MRWRDRSRRRERDVDIEIESDRGTRRKLLQALLIGTGLWSALILILQAAARQDAPPKDTIPRKLVEARQPADDESILRLRQRFQSSPPPHDDRTLLPEPPKPEPKPEPPPPPKAPPKRPPPAATAPPPGPPPETHETRLIVIDQGPPPADVRRQAVTARLVYDAISGFPVIAQTDDGARLVGTASAEPALGRVSITFSRMLLPSGGEQKVHAVAADGTAMGLPARCKRVQNRSLLGTLRSLLLATGGAAASAAAGASVTEAAAGAAGAVAGAAMARGVDDVTRLMEDMAREPQASRHVCVVRAGTSFRLEHL